MNASPRVEVATPRIGPEPGGLEVAIVRVLGVPCHPHVFRLGEAPCIVGSGPGADLVVDEASVSCRHASFTLVPDGILVEDLGSANGTHYLGQRIEKMRVAIGSCIDLGATRICFEPEGLAGRSACDSIEPLPAAECSRLAAAQALVAESAAMQRVVAVIHRLRRSRASVLISGESGVGKELVARALHRTSEAALGPFVAINCGAIARDELASELFGHGPGASETRRGAFASADGGTLFLDQVGELPLDVQPALLRALEAGEIRPIGADTTHHVDVRILAATSRDLRAEVATGLFREDLYYRLAVVSLALAPLRHRPEDIEPLAASFARGHGIDELPASLVEQLKMHAWPGNARELRNTISTFAALGVVSLDRAAAAPRSERLRVDLDRPYVEQRDELCDRFTKTYLSEILQRAEGNLSKAARLAKLDRSYLSRLLARVGLSPRARG